MNQHHTTTIYEKEYVKHLFDRMSRSYERMNYITSFGFSLRWRRQFLKVFEKNKDEKTPTIIDLITGMGETWVAIRQQFPLSQLTALDFSEGMLRYAHQKNNKQYGGSVALVQQDILANSLPAQHFDYVICAFGLKTFNAGQLNSLAQEIERILKPQGQFSFIEISKPHGLILRTLYGFYLGKVIPLLGLLLLANPQEYKMLWTYTQQFGDARAAAAIFEAEGLEVTFTSYFGGCATGFYGRKK